MKKTFSLRVKKRLDEVFLVEPTDFNDYFFTRIYKFLTEPLKNLPFLVIIPFSFILAVLSYFFLGYLIVKIVSLLQYGF